MNELNLQQLENLEGGKFWGSSFSGARIDNNCASGYSRIRTYRVFGIVTSTQRECFDPGDLSCNN